MSFMHDIGDIDFPEDWTQHTIEEVAHFSRGLSWAKRDETDKDNGNLVVSIPNVRDGHIDFESKFNHYLGCPIPEAKRLRVGDIVFVGSSGSLQNVGRNAKVRELPTPVVAFASFTFKATPDREVIDPDFFYHLVNSDLVPFEDYCSRAADGKFNFQLVDFKSKQQLRLPGKEEQQRIAQVLSTVQEAIAQQERLIRTTTELKQALMQKLFTEGLRGEALKETEIGRVPESWEVQPLAEYCVHTAFGPRFSSDLYASDGNVVTLRTTDMDEYGAIDYSEAPRARLDIEKYTDHIMQVNDVVVSRSGTCGITGVFEGHPLPVLPGAFLLRLRLNEKLAPQYLRHYFNSPVGAPRVQQLAQGAIQKNISGTRLKGLLVPVPRIEEQRAIAESIAQVDRKHLQITRKHSALQDLFRTLLHELMTGKVRVANPEK